MSLEILLTDRIILHTECEISVLAQVDQTAVYEAFRSLSIVLEEVTCLL